MMASMDTSPVRRSRTGQLNHLVILDFKGFGLFIGISKLGGGFKYFYFQPYLGKIPILTNIFQRG